MIAPISLNGPWQYRLAADAGAEAEYTSPDFAPADWQVIELPDANIAHDGVLWLYSTFQMPPNEACSVWWLECTGVADRCKIWVNGQAIGEHHGAFTRFRFDVTYAVAMEQNSVLLCVTGEGRIWGDIALSPYDCSTPPATDDWYEAMEKPVVTVKADDGTWWREDAPYFPRGCTYQPENYIGERTAQGYSQDLERMKEANINIVHVTNRLLHPRFYELCDEYGMLIWQDVPTEDAIEAAEIAQQLGHHLAIAVWDIRGVKNPAVADAIRAVDPQRHIMSHSPKALAYYDIEGSTTDALKIGIEGHRLNKSEGINGVVTRHFCHVDTPAEHSIYDAQADTLDQNTYNALKHSLPPLHPIARLDIPNYPQVNKGESFSGEIAIVNDLPKRFEKWLLKVSLTGWIPSSETEDEATYMHHWSELYTDLVIDPCSKLHLGTVQIPPLLRTNINYHLVLQLFDPHEESFKAAVNTYVLTAVE